MYRNVKKEGDDMFFGEFRHNIDPKGRLSIPSGFREYCGEKVYITRGHEGCLALYTEDGWKNYCDELKANFKGKANERIFLRLLNSRAKNCEFDKLGRISIPLTLREEACLEKECVVIGVGDYVEIWNASAWDQFYEEFKDDFDKLGEEIHG